MENVNIVLLLGSVYNKLIVIENQNFDGIVL